MKRKKFSSWEAISSWTTDPSTQMGWVCPPGCRLIGNCMSYSPQWESEADVLASLNAGQTSWQLYFTPCLHSCPVKSVISPPAGSLALLSAVAMFGKQMKAVPRDWQSFPASCPHLLCDTARGSRSSLGTRAQPFHPTAPWDLMVTWEWTISTHHLLWAPELGDLLLNTFSLQAPGAFTPSPLLGHEEPATQKPATVCWGLTRQGLALLYRSSLLSFLIKQTFFNVSTHCYLFYQSGQAEICCSNKQPPNLSD